MSVDWPRLTIGMVGGDRREQEIARQAVATGARVKAYAIPWPEEGIGGLVRADSIGDALRDADFALFPIPGIAPDGALHAPFTEERVIPTREALAGMRSPAHIILGWADTNLKGHADALGIGIHEYEWDRELMLLRGPAIIEGLLRVIVERTEFTIHRSRVVQVGQGAIGALVTRTLLALGARVHVAARNADSASENRVGLPAWYAASSPANGIAAGSAASAWNVRSPISASTAFCSSGVRVRKSFGSSPRARIAATNASRSAVPCTSESVRHSFPPPGGSVESRVPAKPSFGFISATTAATYRAHGGRTKAGSSWLARWISATPSNCSDPSMTQSPPRSPVTSAPRPMAMGNTRPPT